MKQISEEKRENLRTQIFQCMETMANGKVNDAVKLAFLDREQLEEIDRLELGALAEFKRSGNGTVEIKLVDRMAALEKLIELTGGGKEKAELLFRALERSAAGTAGGEPQQKTEPMEELG